MVPLQLTPLSINLYTAKVYKILLWNVACFGSFFLLTHSFHLCWLNQLFDSFMYKYSALSLSTVSYRPPTPVNPHSSLQVLFLLLPSWSSHFPQCHWCGHEFGAWWTHWRKWLPSPQTLSVTSTVVKAEWASLRASLVQTQATADIKSCLPQLCQTQKTAFHRPSPYLLALLFFPLLL